MARRLCRNRKITITTRATARNSSSSTCSTEARMPRVRSASTVTLTEGGRPLVSCGSCVLMASTVRMTLAPGWRWTLTMIAGVMPAQAASRTFSALSTTWATSESRTGAPLR